MLVQKGQTVVHLHGRRQYSILPSTGKPRRIVLCPLKDKLPAYQAGGKFTFICSRGNFKIFYWIFYWKQRSELSSDALQIAGLLRTGIEEGWTIFKFKNQGLHSSPSSCWVTLVHQGQSRKYTNETASFNPQNALTRPVKRWLEKAT